MCKTVERYRTVYRTFGCNCAFVVGGGSLYKLNHRFQPIAPWQIVDIPPLSFRGMTPEKNGMALAAEDEEAIDVVLREGGVSAKLVKSALEDDLLPLLPLVICTPQTDELLNALQERLCTSRVLKLRYLLLRNHHAFRSIPCKRRFSSMAYGPVTCSRDFQKSKKLVVEADEKTEPVGLRLLVDMVSGS